MNRFQGIGIIEESEHRPLADVESFFTEMEAIFDNPAFTKEEVVAIMADYLPNFEHIETGKSLDSKM
jgi:hypothetical protein